MTKIPWADRVWNPIIGCSPVSAGCENCYAARRATRLAGNPKTPEYRDLAAGGKWTGKVRLLDERLVNPLRWRKPCRVFVNSMGDLFHKSVSHDCIGVVFGLMAMAMDHTFLILTKRPDRMREWMREGSLSTIDWGSDVAGRIIADTHPRIVERFRKVHDKWPLPNVWLGVSVEDQQTANERIPILLDTPAAVRFVSYEPALELINIDWALGVEWSEAAGRYLPEQIHILGGHPRLDWIICGPETGPRARGFNGLCAQTVRNQCVGAGVPFFFKGWPSGYIPGGDKRNKYMLDGREWREFPKS